MATTLAFRQAIRSLSTAAGTPPSSSKHSASSARVVSRRWSVANRTNRTRLQASTAQKHCKPAVGVQSITRYSPGTGTQGRYTRRCFRHCVLATATARRRFRSEPA